MSTWKKRSIWGALAAFLAAIVAVKTGIPVAITQPVIEQAGCAAVGGCDDEQQAAKVKEGA